MHLLKPLNKKGKFVTNLRTTVRILKDSCRYVPRTAFKRPVTSVTINRSLSTQSTQAVYELDFELKSEIEAEEVIVLDEPSAEPSANFNL
jgi:hypothetical protein